MRDARQRVPRLTVTVAVVAVLLGAVALAFVVGTGPPLLGPSEPESDAAPSSNGTPAATAGGDGSSTARTSASDDGEPFGFVVEGIETCGQTCRDVTVALHNRQDASASDVTVRSRIFAGESTDQSDLVWEGTERVGTLGAGETYTTTERVELSYFDAIAVQSAGGRITIQTTVQTSDRTVTFTSTRDVT